MAFIAPSLTNYNASPPSDDGTRITSNQLRWAYIKSKLSDPLRNYIDDLSAATSSAFDSLFLGSSEVKAAAFGTGTEDDGKLFRCTASFTVTMVPAAAVPPGFIVAFRVEDDTPVTLDGDGATINGAATLVLQSKNDWAILTTDSIAWYALTSDSVSTILRTEDVIQPTDIISFTDISDNNVAKRDTVQGILDLAATLAQGVKADTALQPGVKATIEAETAGAGLAADTAKYHPGVAKAWVNFNGTGTPAIRSGYNVASITDNATGDYTVNFTEPMADANYCVVANYVASAGGSTAVGWQAKVYDQTVNGFSISTGGDGTTSGSLSDTAIITAVVFGGL